MNTKYVFPSLLLFSFEVCPLRWNYKSKTSIKSYFSIRHRRKISLQLSIYILTESENICFNLCLSKENESGRRTEGYRLVLVIAQRVWVINNKGEKGEGH